MRRLAAILIATLALAACADPRAAQNQRMADAFLAANGKTPGVITLPSGLEYSVAHNGPPGGCRPGPPTRCWCSTRVGCWTGRCSTPPTSAASRT